MSASADTASHASVTSATLRLLSSIALSSELATLLYQGKIKFQYLADSKVKED